MTLTERRKNFIEEYLGLRCKNMKQAAINAGYSEKSAASQASQILKDPKVSEYLEMRKNEIRQELQEEFVFDALEARKVMYEIMKDTCAKDADKINVAKDFLDRAGFKPQDKVEVSGSLETETSKLDAIIEQMRGDPDG